MKLMMDCRCSVVRVLLVRLFPETLEVTSAGGAFLARGGDQ